MFPNTQWRLVPYREPDNGQPKSMKSYTQPIFTLEARGNVMLEVMRDRYLLDSAAMHREIQCLHFEAINALERKGISYSELKSALIPKTDRHEAGFIFNSQVIESAWYGCEVARQILPLLDHRSTQSVLCGDLLGHSQQVILDILNEFMVLARPFEFVHGTLLYCVYINNLSEATLQRLHEGLSKYHAYLGYIPATYQTRGKTYLSTTLARSFLKYGRTILMGHEDDRSDDENVNMAGFPFENFGYEVRSLRATHFDLFLSFKVERAVYPGFEVDTEMSLNAVSLKIVPLQDCNLQLDDRKFGYLKSEKLGKLRKAGLDQLDREQLAELIKSKIVASYIYNLTFLDQYNVIKFNVIIEVPDHKGGYPTRFVAALEYKPDAKVLKVETLT